MPTGRRGAEARAAAAAVEGMGEGRWLVTCDVTDNASLESLLQTCARTFGSVQILVNCAGRTKRTPTLDVPDSEWDSILETNLNGTLRACRVFGRHMVERGMAALLILVHSSSFVGLYEVAAYCASKGAVASLTKSLAVEWAKFGVCVNAIAPGVFRTDLNSALLDGTDRGTRISVAHSDAEVRKVDELGGAAVFLASDAASFVTGHLLVVDGGFLASGVNQ